ncbi:MAG: glycolate oxidase subunit GlcF [bacterium]
MQTHLADFIKNTDTGEKANRILRTCVHCGFCNATCPTYQLLGDEQEGPRGRIYLIKQVLEGKPVSSVTQTHLDHCLTCRNCETTCPSGVEYGELLKIGRSLIDQQVERPASERLMRKVLLGILPYEKRFTPLLRTGQLLRPLLPPYLKAKTPPRQHVFPPVQRTHARRVILLRGCAQPGLKPNTNRATERVLDKLGIAVVYASKAGCCGAVNEHMGDEVTALRLIKQNIDAWSALLEDGAEAIIMTASGCGSVVKDYGKLLENDPEYATKAAKVSAVTRDITEFLSHETPSFEAIGPEQPKRVAWHAPCTLQHHQKITGLVEKLLGQAGYTLVPQKEHHLCCGSAGTYSILQPELSTQLKNNKLKRLEEHSPDMIVTANIGCQVHLESGTDIPVKHWIEIIEPLIEERD